MKLLVLIDNYPSESDLYSNVFAHVRIKEYIKKGHEVEVAITSIYKQKKDYFFEGVKVHGSAKNKDIKALIAQYKPDAILVHFALRSTIYEVITKETSIPFIIWVHGYEALGWYRRLYNFNALKPKTYFKLASAIAQNTLQLIAFKKLVKHCNNTSNKALVFVSEWMKEITEKDCHVHIDRFEIVGNPIDTTLFSYKEKTDSDRFNLLMIRPFNSKKYGTDLVTEALVILKDKPFFNQLHIEIYGKGAHESKLYQLFKNEPNVHIHNNFLSQQEIKKNHDKNGIFLAISRQDAQGVSMCEAMSSGLVVLSSNNTAIPEYVPDMKAGILTNNTPLDIAKKIELIINDVALFHRLSKEGSLFIQDKVGLSAIIEKELQIITKQVNSNIE